MFLIYYGTNTVYLRTVPLPGVACPACATVPSLSAKLFGRYVHIMWLPLFPRGKSAVVECAHCRRTWEDQALPREMRAAVAALQHQTRSPAWQWSGLALLAVGLAVGGARAGAAAVADARDARANATYLAAPRIGDVYTVRVRNSEDSYSLLKVVGTRSNGVEVVANLIVTVVRHPLYLNIPDKYARESYPLTRLDLQAMQRQGQLIDVDRPGE